MEEGEKHNGESLKNVSDRFLDLIFDSLRSLQENETCMKEGCANLVEYMREFNIPSSDINNIQVKNMQLMINEFDKLFKNITPIVEKDTMKNMKQKLNEYQKVMDKGYINKEGKTFMIYKSGYDQLKKTNNINIKPLFYMVGNQLSDLRGEVILSLKHILYTQKTKDKKPREIY